MALLPYTRTQTGQVYLPLVIVSAGTLAPIAHLQITGIRAGGDNEHVEITNTGTATQDMTGWYLQSYRGSDCTPLPEQVYWLPYRYMLLPGASVFVHSGPDASNSPPGHLYWTDRHIWADSGDVAALYAGSRSIDRYAYGNCDASTTGPALPDTYP